MNGSEKITIKCQVCGKDIDTEKECFYKATEYKESWKRMNFCEKDWKENSKQYLENWQRVYRIHIGEGKIELLKLERECNTCKKIFLVKEVDLNEKNDLCYECLANENTEVEQQLTAETTNYKNPESISGGGNLIIIFLLVGAGITGGIVYYFWNKNK